MPCSCQLKNTQTTSADVTYQPGTVSADLPHEVLPDESCIFCALKHVSTAYASWLADHDLSLVIGDLELARRHTAVEYPAVCRTISEAEYAACTRAEDLATKLKTAVEAVEKQTLEASPDTRSAVKYATAAHATNALIGEVHLCAAYRLAYEVGYMMPNKAMLIGDLDLAAESLVRYDYATANELRERRHQIERARASDINIYWPYICRQVAKKIDAACIEKYRDGLSEYLGL